MAMLTYFSGVPFRSNMAMKAMTILMMKFVCHPKFVAIKPPITPARPMPQQY